MFHVVLVEPQIAPNTGNIIRLCANTGCELHLVQPLGFTLDDARMRRAGLDYHEFARLHLHPHWQAFAQAQLACPNARWFALSSKATRNAFDASFQPGDYLVFGSETAGLAPSIRDQCAPDHLLRLPMRPQQRSLNLSNAVAVCVFEAWRQQGFVGAVGGE